MNVISGIVAFTAVTILHHGLARAGFEIEKDGVAFAALVGAYQRALLASLHPAGRSRLLRLASARSERLWISRDKLLGLYSMPGAGSDGAPSACRTSAARRRRAGDGPSPGSR